MGFLNRGCTAHHFDDEEYVLDGSKTKVWTGTQRTDDETIEVLFIKKYETATCEHEGCDATDTRRPNGSTVSVPVNALGMEYDSQRTADVFEAVEEHVEDK